MSGGGGGSGIGPFVGSTAGTQSCETIRVQCALSSPKLKVISTLKVGSVLDIVVDSNGNLVAEHNGAVAGSIVSSNTMRLIDCISKGHGYSGAVLSITKGQVSLEITHT